MSPKAVSKPLILGAEPEKRKGPKLVANSCEVEHILLEIAYMHMDPLKGVKQPVTMWYNTVWLVRWILEVVLCTCFVYHPKTIYAILIPINLAMTVYAILVRNSFTNPLTGLVIMAEEVLVFLLHLFMGFLMWDALRKKGSYMKQTTVMLFVMLGLLIYLIVMFMQFLLLKNALTEVVESDREENLNSQDVRLEEASNDELNNRMKTYNRLKMGDGEENLPEEPLRSEPEEEDLNIAEKKKNNVKFQLGPAVGQNK
jgi:hypothetical protein